MKSGSKGRVRVEFGLQSSGFYRVITIGLPSGFHTMNVLNFGSGLILSGYSSSGFRVPDFITTQALLVVMEYLIVTKFPMDKLPTL